jgi:glycosyltransferase involved in cell wall biosynthesis
MISFIVPAYNEERLLGATLQAINAVCRRWTSRVK